MMETSESNSESNRTSSPINGNPRMRFSAASFIQAPLLSLLEYSGILRTRLNSQENESLLSGGSSEASATRGDGEVLIRIIGGGDQDHVRTTASSAVPASTVSSLIPENEGSSDQTLTSATGSAQVDGGNDGVGQGGPSTPNLNINSGDTSSNGVTNTSLGGSNRDSSFQRYDFQQIARWIEQILPFSLLLLVVFIRQHLQGFFVTIWIAAVMFKSNDIVRKQTALKGERKFTVLLGFASLFTLHVAGVYWWYINDDLFYPLVMLPPRTIPPFWHAIFIIMVNDTMVRQAAMAFKCILLMHYTDNRGRSYRKQGQMLTLVEYLLLLYRALLPTPVWYRFFLNKEYGGLFSSLITGLYLTFKLTSVLEKVQSFFIVFKALTCKDVLYGCYATTEQVNAVGDLCAICQEKMHGPILLRCKHIFCEECVSEWFERERTCPLCRALVKPADLKSFGDGSTSLFFQFF